MADLTEEDSTIRLILHVEVVLDVKGIERDPDSIRQMARLQSLSAHAEKVVRFFEETTDAHTVLDSSESMPREMADALDEGGISNADDAWRSFGDSQLEDNN